jgi:hypothetical protein
MGAAALGLISPIQGAIAQEFIDLMSILNSLRMILPTGSLSDFQIPAAVQQPRIQTPVAAGTLGHS